MPQMGVSVSEGTITKWLKQPGEHDRRRTRRCSRSRPTRSTPRCRAPVTGVVAEILVAEGETVEVGTVLAVIAPAGSAVAEPAGACRVPAPAAEAAAARAPRAGRGRSARPLRLAAEPRRRPGNGRTFVSPGGGPHRLRARRRPDRRPGHGHRRPRDEEGHPRLHRVRRPGAAAAPAPPLPRAAPAAAPAAARSGARRRPRSPPPPAPAAAPLQQGEVEEPMTAMRRGVMEHMRRSLDTSAHVTSAIEVDMSKIVAARERLKQEYQAAYGVNPTYLAFIAHGDRRDAARLPVDQRRDPRRVDRHAPLGQPRHRRRARGRQGPDRAGDPERRRT